MGYVEKILGDNERVVYETHLHAIVLLRRTMGWLLAFLGVLAIGLLVLLWPKNELGARIRWWIGLIALVSVSIHLFPIVSSWAKGSRGRELLTRSWRSMVAAVLTVVIALTLMIRPDLTQLGWIAVVLSVALCFEFARNFSDWLSERYIITNRRVMEVKGIVNKHVRDSALEKVNDVDLTQSFVGRLLRYGTVQIITGSDIGVNMFRRISNPVRFKREMLNAKEKLSPSVTPDLEVEAPPSSLEAEQGLPRWVQRPLTGVDGLVTTGIPELIAELDKLRKEGILSEEEFQVKKQELLRRL